MVKAQDQKISVVDVEVPRGRQPSVADSSYDPIGGSSATFSVCCWCHH